MPPKPKESDQKAIKVSMSLPPDLAKFLDDQCAAFGVGRSAYLQLLLDAEQESPRPHFTKRAKR
jgi:hypothetical protein